MPLRVCSSVLGSIPAPAGEPTDRQGGVIGLEGLSPRLRGNPNLLKLP